MNQSLPDYWKHRLDAFLSEKTNGQRQTLSATDFPQVGLQLSFPDGSLVAFRFAFHLMDTERAQIAVFTEHCGYHVFPAEGVEIVAQSDQA